VAGPVDELIEACATGIPGAIVTNPDVVAGWFRVDGRDPVETAAELVDRTVLPLFLQLAGPDRVSFLRQADAIARRDPRLLPKLPATAAGLAAAADLSTRGPLLITAVSSFAQAAMAAAAGARFLCPYFARLRDAGIDPAALCERGARCFARLGCHTEFVPASIRSIDDFESALAAGATGGIVFTGLFREMLDHPATAAALAGFDAAWKSLPPTCLNS
jgi:transaldolase